MCPCMRLRRRSLSLIWPGASFCPTYAQSQRRKPHTMLNEGRNKENHITMSLCFLPFNILTATVLQVAVLSIPKASASITWPKAPRPRGFPGTNDNGNYKIWLSRHTIRGLWEDSDWLKGCCIPFRPTFHFTPSFWLSPVPSKVPCFGWLYRFLNTKRLSGWLPKIGRYD